MPLITPGRPCGACLCLLIGISPWLPVAHASSHSQPAMQFDAHFLRQAGTQPDSVSSIALDALADSTSLPPGRYRVDVVLNLEFVGNHELTFTLQDERLDACLPGPLLVGMGVRLESLQDPTLATATCLDLPAVIPGATSTFDAATLRLTLSVPQIAMRRDLASQVETAQWDHGINAAFINYQASTYQGHNRYSGRYSSADLNINSGVNLGAWRLRSSQAWRENGTGATRWSRSQTYAQRGIAGLRGNLTIGETFLDSDVFRGIPLLGVQVASDTSMLPDTLQQYAPIIRGVAQTRAKLEVWQNGYPIYTTYVSPGPYAIDDLSPGGSGELDIVLTEDDGRVHRYTQPYATLSNLLREGVWRYSIAVGRYNPAASFDRPTVWQSTAAVGMPWNTTLYGGLMASHYYHAANIGLGKDLGDWGALGLDITQANSEAASGNQQGQSHAIRYGKTFASQTTLRFAGYRYSTRGYRDFDEAVREHSGQDSFMGARRSRLEAAVHQPVGQRSGLSLTYSQQDYWQRSTTQRQYQVNFTTHHGGVNYSLFASQSLNDDFPSQRLFGLTLSMPLDIGHSATASFDALSNNQGHSQRATLNGSSTQYPISYSASLSQNESKQKAAALSIAHQGRSGSLGAGFTEAGDYRSLSLNASGALLFHEDGLAVGPYLGDTAALIEVPDIADVGVRNATGALTNAKGFALVPHLQPYRNNSLVLQTDRLGPEVEIDNGSARVVPTRGAVVKHRFEARRVTRLVLTLRTAQGRPLPFGAQVVDSLGKQLGIVGQAGQVMLSTHTQAQVLSVRWNEHEDGMCQVAVDPKDSPAQQGYHLLSLVCG